MKTVVSHFVQAANQAYAAWVEADEAVDHLESAGPSEALELARRTWVGAKSALSEARRKRDLERFPFSY